MSATATTTARIRAGRERGSLPRRPQSHVPEPGRATLDDRITALWTRLVEEGAAECPVCGDEMHAGRACGGCHSQLG